MTEEITESTGTLQIGEVHPASHSALEYLMEYIQNNPPKAMRWLEAFSSSGLSGNRLGEVCAETLHRLIRGEMVSDRYLLALAWTIKEMEEHQITETEEEKSVSQEKEIYKDEF